MHVSATIMIRRRFQRSTSAPTKGPSTICGSSATSVAVASTVAEPVLLVSHQTRANCTSDEPTSEKACPVQMVKNLAAQRSGTEESGGMVVFSKGVSNSDPQCCHSIVIVRGGHPQDWGFRTLFHLPGQGRLDRLTGKEDAAHLHGFDHVGGHLGGDIVVQMQHADHGQFQPFALALAAFQVRAAVRRSRR